MAKSMLELLSEFVSEHKMNLFHTHLQHRTRHLTVAIENIFQPHNASAVLRSCDCFGVQDVHIIENDNEYRINPQVALGASQWLNLHRYNTPDTDNTTACIQQLRSKGYRIVATTPHTNDTLLADLDITQPTALLFGTEKGGLSEIALEQADAFVKIPMYGFTESFNISVSAAITLYELTEKMRNTPQLEWELTDQEKEDVLLSWVKQTVAHSDKIIREYQRRQKG